MWTSGAFAITDQNTQGPGSSEMISEEQLLLLPPWRPGDLPVHGQHSGARFYFRSWLLELAGAVDRLTYCLARIRAWMKASWQWPNPDKSKVVLTSCGREGGGRTFALYGNNLVFIVQISRPRDLSVLASAHPLIIRRMKGLFAFCWSAFLDQKVEPILLNMGLSYTKSSRLQKLPLYQEQCKLSSVQAKAGVWCAASPAHSGCSIDTLHSKQK